MKQQRAICFLDENSTLRYMRIPFPFDHFFFCFLPPAAAAAAGAYSSQYYFQRPIGEM